MKILSRGWAGHHRISTGGLNKLRRTLFVFLCLGGPCIHGETDAPIEEPVAVLQRAAAVGDPTSQFLLALRLSKGREIKRDTAQAIAWYRKSAAGGFPAAQYNLAVALSQGQPSPEALKEAARWYAAAAQNGLFDAQKVMIQLHTQGLGVEKSAAKALAWDILARRTLELRYGLPAGLPPHPSALRADGSAEVTNKDGTKSLVHADGSREVMDREGLRHVEHPNGCKTVIEPDGGWVTTYPNGLTQTGTAEGRMTFRSPDGTLLIMEPDGSRIEEGAGTKKNGDKVRIRDAFDRNGQRLTHRVSDVGETLEERADGRRFLETKVRRSDRVWVILVQEISANGAASDGKVHEENNQRGPQADETWIIRRVIRTSEGEDVGIKEVYSSTGLVSRERETEPGQVVTPSTPSTPLPITALVPAATPRSSPRTIAAPPVTSRSPTPPPSSMMDGTSTREIIVGPGTTEGEDPSAFAPRVDLKPMLADLEKLEAEARNFAGATEADYQRAQAAARTYLIPLGITPQKAANTSAWLRGKLLTSITLPVYNVNPIADDRSSVIPFGVHGVEAIKLAPWKHMETDHFVVHYVGDAEARLVMQFIEGAYTVVTQLLNIDPDRGVKKSHVFIFSESGWDEYLKKHDLSPQIAGFALRTELLLGADAARQDRELSIKVLCHEVTHALVSRFYAGRRLPLWLNEGLAEYIAVRTMKVKGVKGSTLPVSKPDATMDVARLFRRERYGARTSPERLSAFYANSQKAVRTLFEKLPVDGFGGFFNLIAAGNEPGVALAATYGPQCDSIKAFEGIVNKP